MDNKTKYFSLPELQQRLPVFFQPWWLDIVSDNWDMILAENDGTILGVWPCCVDKKLGLHITRNPLLTPYLGPCFFYPEQFTEEQKTDFEQTTFQHLWQQLPPWDSFDLEAVVSFTNHELFRQKGFDISSKITYEIDLNQAEEQLFSAIHNNHRNLIKQAAQCNEIVEGEEYLPKLLQLHRETFSRKKKPYPFPAVIIENLVTESLRLKSGNLLAIKNEENYITACIFTVWDKDKMYLLLSAVDLDHAHPGAVRLLIWHAIKAAKHMGARIFDFEGSMDPGIEAFFRRFGGERKTYLCASKNKSLLWKIKKTLLG